jgi:putative salt-induced outer membrane protein
VTKFFSFCVLFCAFSAASAQEEEGPWSGKATLGYLSTSGNTENSTLNTGLRIEYSTGDWVHSARANAVNATEDNMTTAEAYELGAKSELSFGEYDFIFARANWRKDRFSGYDTQFSQSIGYGRRLIETDAHQLNAEIGGGARQSDLVDGTSTNEFIVRGGIDYRWKISENAEFRQDISVESGDENTYLESVSAVSAQLLGNLALVFSYTIKNNSDVPLGRENRDTYIAASLEYLF